MVLAGTPTATALLADPCPERWLSESLVRAVGLLLPVACITPRATAALACSGCALVLWAHSGRVCGPAAYAMPAVVALPVALCATLAFDLLASVLGLRASVRSRSRSRAVPAPAPAPISAAHQAAPLVARLMCPVVACFVSMLAISQFDGVPVDGQRVACGTVVVGALWHACLSWSSSAAACMMSPVAPRADPEAAVGDVAVAESELV